MRPEPDWWSGSTPTGSEGRKTVVVIGAGFAGLAAAADLGGSEARVIVIDRQNHHVFQPLLYQVATASLSGTDIAQPIRHILKRHRNIEVLRGEVTGVDRVNREVRLADRRVRYDWLIVASGAENNYFSHEDWRGFAPGLKTLADAQRIRSGILEAFEAAEKAEDDGARRRALTFVIVGGGPTGVELAGSIAELARHTLTREFRNIDPQLARILIYEAGPTILANFPSDLVDYAQRELARLGVDVRTDAPILAIGDREVTTGEGSLPADTIIWTAGVKAGAVGNWLSVDADRAGRVAVDQHLRLPGDPDVFVLGDCALALDPEGRPLPGLAQVARQQGKHAAAHIRNLLEGRKPEPFRYRNLGSWAIVGRNAAIARIGRWKLRGRAAWAAWGILHIALLVGFENRFRVLVKWFWEYLTRRRSARLIVVTDTRQEKTAPAAEHPGAP